MKQIVSVVIAIFIGLAAIPVIFAGIAIEVAGEVMKRLDKWING